MLTILPRSRRHRPRTTWRHDVHREVTVPRPSSCVDRHERPAPPPAGNTRTKTGARRFASAAQRGISKGIFTISVRCCAPVIVGEVSARRCCRRRQTPPRPAQRKGARDSTGRCRDRRRPWLQCGRGNKCSCRKAPQLSSRKAPACRAWISWIRVTNRRPPPRGDAVAGAIWRLSGYAPRPPRWRLRTAR